MKLNIEQVTNGFTVMIRDSYETDKEQTYIYNSIFSLQIGLMDLIKEKYGKSDEPRLPFGSGVDAGNS